MTSIHSIRSTSLLVFLVLTFQGCGSKDEGNCTKETDGVKVCCTTDNKPGTGFITKDSDCCTKKESELDTCMKAEHDKAVAAKKAKATENAEAPAAEPPKTPKEGDATAATTNKAETPSALQTGDIVVNKRMRGH